MSVVVLGKRFGTNLRALLLACLHVLNAAPAHADAGPVHFHAASVPRDGVAAMRPARETAEVASFAAFVPLPDPAGIRAQIASLEEEGEFFSPRIAELAEQLGKVLQANGEHREALAAFERSLHASRRNEGLFSRAQEAVLEAMIGSQLALDDLDAADTLHLALLALGQDLHAASPVDLAQTYRAAADWNLTYYLRHAPQTARTSVPGGMTDAMRQALAVRLGTALDQYHHALRLLATSNAEGLREEKIGIERSVAALVLLVDRHFRPDPRGALTEALPVHSPVLATHGHAALQRAAAYVDEAPDPVQLAARQLELADWHLLMDQPDEARAAYGQAIATLRSAALPEAELAVLVGSGLPVSDPAAELVEALHDGGEVFDGYIDVAFDLGRDGKARNARVLAGMAYESAYDESLEAILLRQLRAGRFRPAFDRDAPVARDDIRLRYYFAR